MVRPRSYRPSPVEEGSQPAPRQLVRYAQRVEHLADDVTHQVVERARQVVEAGTGGHFHLSEYGCQASRDMLELGKPRSNYQAQAGDEET